MAAVEFHWQKALAGERTWGDCMLVINTVAQVLFHVSLDIASSEYVKIDPCREDLNLLFLVANKMDGLEYDRD